MKLCQTKFKNEKRDHEIDSLLLAIPYTYHIHIIVIYTVYIYIHVYPNKVKNYTKRTSCVLLNVHNNNTPSGQY